jgi:hypothetical protein
MEHTAAAQAGVAKASPEALTTALKRCVSSEAGMPTAAVGRTPLPKKSPMIRVGRFFSSLDNLQLKSYSTEVLATPKS